MVSRVMVMVANDVRCSSRDPYPNPPGPGARDEIPTAGRNKYTAEISNRGSSNATKQEYIGKQPHP